MSVPTTIKTFCMPSSTDVASPAAKAEERIITPDNLLLLTDSYKVSHHVQYPEGTTTIYSYFEPRKGGLHKEICFFGLQYFIKRYLVGQVVTREKIDEAKALYERHFGPGTNVFNEEGWLYILEKYGGQLPVIIKAVPEGQILPEANACMTVENTDPKCFWLVNFLETLLVQVWYPMTVATNSREQKKILAAYLQETGDPSSENLEFKLHDFGFRGVSSVESAALGGAAHLTQFLGSDTIAGITMARDYYGEPCAGFSIPASEHSTMTSWGEDADDGLGECAAYENMLDKYPKGLVAIVSDSYNIWNAVDMYGSPQLQDKIKKRAGTLVIRPDSGPPPLMDIELLRKLYQYFSADNNEQGYKELDSHVRVIQGDGIDYHRLQVIVELLKRKGWSINNIAFGSGGGLLQKLNRDTQKCAFKCSYAVVGGKEIDVQKRPIHAPGKKSKRGRLKVVKKNGTIVTLTADPDDDGETAKTTDRPDILVTVFENGHSRNRWTWAEVKEKASLGNFLNSSDEVGEVKAKAEAAADAYLASKYASDVHKMQQAQYSSDDTDGRYEVPFKVL